MSCSKLRQKLPPPSLQSWCWLVRSDSDRWKQFRLEVFKMDLWQFRPEILAIQLPCRVNIRLLSLESIWDVLFYFSWRIWFVSLGSCTKTKLKSWKNLFNTFVTPLLKNFLCFSSSQLNCRDLLWTVGSVSAGGRTTHMFQNFSYSLREPQRQKHESELNTVDRQEWRFHV